MRLFPALAAAAALLTSLPAAAQQRAAAARENFQIEHEIGRRFQIDPANLPGPRIGQMTRNGPQVVAYDGQSLALPPGFTATPFASAIQDPRRLLVLPDGDVLVALQRPGQVLRLHDDGSGRAAVLGRYEGFKGPYGLALRGDQLLVADMEGIWTVPNAAADARAEQRPAMLTAKGVFGAVQGHSNRPIVVDPRTGALFVGVGSISNTDVEPEPKATIQRFDPDGSNQTTFVSGTRNPTTLALHPRTGELWAGVQERDGLGDDLPSDYLIRPEANGFYGWPYAYLGKNPQPAFSQLARDKVDATIVPDLLFQAHSSLLDLVFYEADRFPSEYRGHAFAALKGSWNRSRPTGYKLVRVPFRDGRPEGFYENFATGFWASGERRAEVWGRPAALAVTRDGALLVADDTGGTIWRIAYTGGR
jgi:glucose/arabinose dehydrogenase